MCRVGRAGEVEGFWKCWFGCSKEKTCVEQGRRGVHHCGGGKES